MCYFCSLHNHSEFSTLDGFGKAGDFALRAKELNYSAVGKTDHGNICGNLGFYNTCKDKGIKPILGMEAYFEPTFNKEEAKAAKIKGGFSHLTLFAKDAEGYGNLMKIVTESNLEENFYYKPITTLENLKNNRKGVVCLSGCILSKVGRYLRNKNLDAAEGLLGTFRNIFEGDFYLEVMPPFISKNHDENDLLFHKFQIDYNTFIIEYGKKHKIPVVMTTDAHYASKDDWQAYKVMRTMSQKKEPDDHYRFRYLMDAETIIKYWNKFMPAGYPCEEYLENTGLVVNKCNVELDFGNSIPKIDWGEPSNDKLIKIAIRGLKMLGKYTEDYKERLIKELNTVIEKGYSDYFLLCYSIMQKAKSLEIATGFGRGSVCGSVLAYSLGITQVDPLLLDISFDRFLRPNKNTLPDIDLDFDSRGQHRMMDFLLEEFHGRSSRICNYLQYKSKNLFNDLAKHYNVEEEDLGSGFYWETKDGKRKKVFTQGVKDLIEDYVDEHGADYNEMIKNDFLKGFDDKYGLLKPFCKIYGQVKAIGKHAAGVALTDKPFFNYDSIMRIGSEYVSGHDMTQLDNMGIVKMDILGLNNVSVIKDVEKITGAKFSYDILNDKAVYKAFCDGNTAGIFQFESNGAQKVIDMVKPINIQELMACNSLNRPGQLKRIDDSSSTLELYCEGKEGKIDKHNFWYPYTKETYGAVIYQDQILAVCREVAGLSWDDTDLIIKNLSKKVEEKRQKLRPVFVNGCIKNGMSRLQAETFYDKNTLYGFNKAHAAGYSILAAYCMWLKINFPYEFWWALLKNEKDDEQRIKYTACAIRSGVLILPAHVNGKADYELISSNKQLNIFGKDAIIECLDENKKERCIREGLRNIKGLGPKTCEWLESVNQKPFESEKDFMDRVSGNGRKCNSANILRLKEYKALEFDGNKYLDFAVRENSRFVSKFRRMK